MNRISGNWFPDLYLQNIVTFLSAILNFSTKLRRISVFVHGKNSFVEISKNLARYRYTKIILLDYQNNYIERLNIDNKVAKSFNILAISPTIIFLIQTKLFSDLYLNFQIPTDKIFRGKTVLSM